MHIDVSVIIPLYNKEVYIKKTVESVMSQSYLPKEIIIVDDCSTDSSCTVVKSLQKQYPIVRLIALEKNGGVSHARNVGIDAATADYITCVDSDDFYANRDKLKNEICLIKKYLSVGYDICAYSKVARADLTDSIISSYRVPPDRKFLNGDIYKELLTWVNFATAPRDYIVKKSIVIQAGGYDENSCYFEDLDLLYRIARISKFYCTNQIGTAYRITETGLSTSHEGTAKQRIEQIRNTYLNDMNEDERKRILLKRSFLKQIYGIKIRIGQIARKLQRLLYNADK